ncbi:relaxase/mobilization nuclease domain-containing protein [Pseudomonas nitroreducens]|uniref:relaxase/mobilization nuclease domain-containing protein n=1 Tax=Pseudomonas nitroreducens TaxID=46680 RepID=UPI001476164A|nr:relaxase/mobilization nuclease domain-containing protein [Pseudomonas nitroreducens]MDG9856967.1 relaxase/mobilization nuclease domain-containing protein [Pseudomonas nitroreducens]MDH1075775.1 relaxase/mobilization nuclease domain-containing protein [Pseudomonas nitroreducens]NMZ76679.1 relaxase/mobilization nuclease domain-containing protein [Pseudomonas nitroreducens]
MVNEQMKNSKGFAIRVDYVCANTRLEKDIEKRPFVHFLGGNIISGDPFIRYANDAGEQVVDVDTSCLIKELESHAAKYKGQSEELCAHFVLSLAAGETLSKKDLLESARHYMNEMGYGRGSKWFAVVHYDTDNVHIHIVACRAQLIHSDMSPDGRPRHPQFSVVKDSNSYKKGWEACREIEQKFGLQSVENPDQCFGKNGDLFKRGSDQSKILRGIIGDVWKEGKPKTFSDLVMRLNQKGVSVQAVTESKTDGLIKGVLFKLDRPDGRWISGSKLKATRLTFDKLIEKEGINYSPYRDNSLLGLPTHAYTLVKNATPPAPTATVLSTNSALLRVYVNIPANSSSLSSFVKNKGRMYGIFSDSSGMYLGFNAIFKFNFSSKTKKEIKEAIETEWVMKLIKDLMKMLMDAFDFIFHPLHVQVEAIASDDGLTDTALRLNIPVHLDADTLYEQHSAMENAVDEQVENQMLYLSNILLQNDQPALER